jgi:hypothetical protein
MAKGRTAAEQKIYALRKIIHKTGENIHHRKRLCPDKFNALATNGIYGRLHTENPLDVSEPVHNLSEICVRHCINKAQVGNMGETFHEQNDRLIQDSIKSVRLSVQIADDYRTDHNRRHIEK